jgi:hypothetical protein
MYLHCSTQDVLLQTWVQPLGLCTASRTMYSLVVQPVHGALLLLQLQSSCAACNVWVAAVHQHILLNEAASYSVQH